MSSWPRFSSVFFLSPRSVSVGPRINEIHTAGFLGYGEHLDDAEVNK